VIVGSTTESEDQGLGLRHHLAVVRRRWWLVLSVIVVCIAAAGLYSYTQAPKYEATTRIVVGQGRGLISPNVIGNAVQPITATMADLARSNVVAMQVISKLGLKETPESLLKKINVSINPDTAVIKLSVIADSKEQAVAIDSALGSVFSQLVKERFASGSSGQAISPGASTEPLTATVFDPAHARPSAVSPRPLRNMVLAGIIGTVLGLLGVFAREFFDRRLRDREAVERAFGVPVIAQIPFPSLRKDERRVDWGEHGPMPEAFRGLRANLQYLGVQAPLQTLLVTSPGPAQGKTTVASNLAVAIARSGASVVVVEGDLRRPRLNGAFGVRPGGPGLTGVLVGSAAVEEALRELHAASGNLPGRLALLPSGPLPPNPAELLSSFQMREVLNVLRQNYDYVLVDSPPLLAVADALELARMVDGVMMVARKNRASTDEAREVRGLVERLGLNLLGIVLTDTEQPTGYYGNYGERPVPEADTERPVRSGGPPAPEATTVRS
jgi:capsular exopolysaccharide synthesis family protein